MMKRQKSRLIIEEKEESGSILSLNHSITAAEFENQDPMISKPSGESPPSSTSDSESNESIVEPRHPDLIEATNKKFNIDIMKYFKDNAGLRKVNHKKKNAFLTFLNPFVNLKIQSLLKYELKVMVDEQQ